MLSSSFRRLRRRKVTKNQVCSARYLNLHEYQSKKLMDDFGVRTQKWKLATSHQEALNVCKQLDGQLVVKAQVLAGGRGKGTFDNGFKGGVHLADTAEEAAELTQKMLGNKLITKQTPPDGVPVNKVMIAEAIDLETELYLSILMDRESDGPVVVASTEGGMDIEAVAEQTPEKIFQQPIDINNGPTDEQLTKIATNLGFTGELVDQCKEQVARLYELFIKLDAVQVEINPLALTPENLIYCADAKIGFDDNAQFRHKEIFEQADTTEDDPREVEAAKHNLNYIGMEGNIGCMVNGAGLAMATMDIIKLYNGSPANFLDVGGSANEEQITEAFKILTSDPQVKAILVNIFGGIMKCDVIASGVVAAAKSINLQVPLIVRLSGTNVERGNQILKESGIEVITANDLDDAAAKATASIA
eukprot:TRINITY_DN9774_c0_g1_i1.p1 TRINITY_DN9774_c0_g1~~TRINITY_DN9774_c0_g1_i1.p1  ORF type:complete len:417 (-),score=129.55 TRINITY_DN9774_c0_g1_i1:36-1286(-)